MRYIIVLSFLGLLCSCSSTTNTGYTFNGKTAKSVQDSIKEYSNSISEEEQKKFMTAIMRIAFDGLTLEPEKVPFENIDMWELLAKKIDGLSYEEVMVLAQNSTTKVSMEFK